MFLGLLDTADETQQTQSFAVYRQGHAQIAGARFVGKMSAEQARMWIDDLVRLTASHRPTIFQREERLRYRVIAPARDGLEKLVPGAQTRKRAALPREELECQQCDHSIGLLLCGARLKEIVHAIE